jgi:hypothetical protein
MTNEDAILHDAIAELTGSREGQPSNGSGRSSREFPLHAIPSLRRCRRILYTTKVEWLAAITDGLAGVPDDVALVWRYGPLTAPHRALLHGMLHTLDAPMCFVGDLDPLDLATYATLAQGAASAVNYLGISDAWLDRCERGFARADTTLNSVCIAMDHAERDALESLTKLSGRWSDALGPRARLLLQSGLKLELEGASNPSLYSAAFHDELMALLFARA